MNINIPKKIFKASVVGSEIVAHGIKKITFKLKENFSFLVGQYVWVEIIDMKVSDPCGSRRAFSIFNIPNNENSIEIVARVSDSGYKQSLFALPVGETVNIHGPFGSSFVMGESNHPQNIVMIAGGVGIVPFVPLIQNVENKKIPTNLFLVYLNKTKEETPFFGELDVFKKKLKNKFDYVAKYEYFKWEDVSEFISKAKGDTKWYISGPKEMVDFVYSELTKEGVSIVDMVFENFYPSKKNTLKKEDVDSQIATENFFVKGIQNSTNHTIISDANGTVLFANKASQRITGYSLEEIIGNTPRLWGGMMKPEFYKDFWKKKIAGKPFVGEVLNRRKNGEQYYALAHIAPIFGKGKEVIGYIGTEEDISLIKNQEKIILEKEERLKFAIEGNRDGLWDWDLEKDKVYFSPRWKEMLGFKDKEIENVIQEWQSRIHPDDKERVQSDMDNHLKSRTLFFESEYRMKTKNKKYIWVMNRAKVIKRTKEGEPLRIVGTHTDISEKKEREQELERLNKVMVDRELRMIELKEEIKNLKKKKN